MKKSISLLWTEVDEMKLEWKLVNQIQNNNSHIIAHLVQPQNHLTWMVCITNRKISHETFIRILCGYFIWLVSCNVQALMKNPKWKLEISDCNCICLLSMLAVKSAIEWIIISTLLPDVGEFRNDLLSFSQNLKSARETVPSALILLWCKLKIYIGLNKPLCVSVCGYVYKNTFNKLPYQCFYLMECFYFLFALKAQTELIEMLLLKKINWIKSLEL